MAARSALLTGPSTALPSYEASSDDIVIHVCDDSRQIRRDFTCSQKKLTQGMGYFGTHFPESTPTEDIDISVHCDVEIFHWLLQYLYGLNPVLGRTLASAPLCTRFE
jgi:hypothetical protein